MRQVAGDGKHKIMVLGFHEIDLGAAGFPEGRKFCHRIAVRSRHRREDAPTPVEEFGKTRIRPRLLGACDGMPRNKMHSVGNKRTRVAHDCIFYRTDIRHCRTGLECRLDFGADFRKRPHRHTKYDEIGVTGGICRTRHNVIDEANCFGTFARRLGRSITHHRVGKVTTTDRMAERAADKTKADQSNALITRIHDDTHDFLPRNSANEVTSKRFASSVPTVRRR